MSLNRQILTLSIAVGIVVLVLSRLELMPKGTSYRMTDELALQLQRFGIPPSPSSIPATYTNQSLRVHYKRASAPEESRVPDTTAVVLNWSRLQNVILISAVLCSPWLEGTIAGVFIWNNNPNVTLTLETFRETGCSPKKLRIHNSPFNAFFQARYLACAEARTPYCFTQDDDYLVQPEVIDNLHSYFVQKSDAHSVHLLPAHEHLLSRIRTFTSEDGLITTAFAWLGHGTYFTRSSARDFLDLLRTLNVTSDEMRMADNYFTILANRLKYDEIWFDHGIELGGGQPFTVGSEGDSRNDKHIARTLEYLSLLTREQRPAAANHPYVSKSESGSSVPINITPCRVGSCIVSSNIAIVPNSSRDTIKGIDMTHIMTSVASRTLHNLDATEREWYIQYPLANSVDSRPDTAFRSPEAARPGEWFILDVLRVLKTDNRVLELSILTENDQTNVLLQECAFSSSLDGAQWVPIESTLICVEIDDIYAPLVECSIRPQNDAQYFKLFVSGHPRHEKWIVNELWLRYVE